MPLTYDQVARFALSLPGVTEGERWGTRSWLQSDKMLCWVRPFSKADLKRFGDTPPPEGPILGIAVEDLDTKDAILQMGLPGFFTIEHFRNYPALLVALREARASDVKSVIAESHRARMAKRRPARPRRRK